MNSQCRFGFATHIYHLNRVSAVMVISIVLMGLAGCGGSGDMTSAEGNQGSDGTTSAGGDQGSDDTGSTESDSRPSFENLLVDENVRYQNEVDQVEVYQVEFSVSPTNPPTSKGRLTGGVTVRLAASEDFGVSYQVSGNYNGCAVTVKLSTSDGSSVMEPMSVNYSGRFTSGNLLMLVPKKSALPTLRLLRRGEATRESECK